MNSLARLAAIFAILALCEPARSEGLVVTVAPSQIVVSSNYSGGTVVIFGAVQADKLPSRSYDVAAVVTGPRQTVVARRKARIGGVWIN
ncbi:MAG: TIGR02186 family protein, partial [Pseudolabrys sp.]